MKTNEHKRDHMDKEAFARVELFTVTEIIPQAKPAKREIGSLGEQELS